MNSENAGPAKRTTKIYALLLAAMMVWGLIQFIDARRFHTSDLPCVAGIRAYPGVQMELVKRASQVDCLLLAAGSTAGESNRQTMREQQYLDFVFIPLYWAVFWFAIGSPLLLSGTAAGRALAVLVRISISLAALADYLEDMAIFQALRPGYEGPLWPVDFGFPKWTLFFIALGLAAVFFLFYPRFGNYPGAPSRWELVTARGIGVLFGAGSALGLAGAIGALRDGGSLLLLALDPFIVALVLLEFWLISTSRGRRLPVKAMNA